MKVKFLMCAYVGDVELFFNVGDEYEFETARAQELVDAGIVKFVEVEPQATVAAKRGKKAE